MAVLTYPNQNDFEEFGGVFVDANAHNRSSRKLIRLLQQTYPRLKVVECPFDRRVFLEWRAGDESKTPADWAAAQETKWRLALNIAPAGNDYSIGWAAFRLKRDT